MPKPKKSRPLGARLNRTVWVLHRWLGLSLGLVIVVASITGGLLVMHNELDRAFEKDRHIIQSSAEGTEFREINALLLSLQKLAPENFRPLRLEPGFRSDSSEKIVFIHTNRTARWSAFVDPYTGEVLWTGHDQKLLKPWLLHLHENLHAGTLGFIVVGLAAVALTILGFSGIWMARKKVRHMLRRPIRLKYGARIAFSDFHQWVGILTSYFTLILGLTGVWFAWLIIPGLFSNEKTELAPPFDLTQLTPIRPAVAETLKRFPGSEVARVIFPWDEGIALQVRVLHRNAPIWRKQSRIDFDATSGEVLRVRDAKDATFSEQFESILGPLHFGTYGSPLVKWLYVLGGFAPALLVVSGYAIWWSRRRSAANRKVTPASGAL